MPSLLKVGSLVSDPTKTQTRARNGMTMAMLEVKWAFMEPSNPSGDPTLPGQLNTGTYPSGTLDQLRTFRKAGMDVTLGLGLHFTPQWVLDAQTPFVNQAGETTSELNVVYSQLVRQYVRRYIKMLHGLFDLNSFSAIRLHSGGSTSGDIPYPGGAAGHQYWCYSTGAQNGADAPTGLVNPVPGYRPGDAGSTQTQRQQFMDFYLGAIANVIDYQIDVLTECGYNGIWQLLAPGKGSTPTGVSGLITNDTMQNSTGVSKGSAWANVAAAITKRREKGGIQCSSVADNASGSPADNAPVAADKSVSLTNDATITSWSAARWQARVAWENGFWFSGENPGQPNSAGAAMDHYNDTTSAGMLAKALAIMSGAVDAGYKVYGFYWAHDAQVAQGSSNISQVTLGAADTSPKNRRFTVTNNRSRVAPTAVNPRAATYSRLGYDTPTQTMADRSGVPSTAVLTALNAASVTIQSAANITSAGLTYTGTGTQADPYLIQNYDIAMTSGVLTIRMPANMFIKFKNCKIHTSWFGTTDTGVVNTASTSHAYVDDAAIFENCDIYADAPSYYINGMFGHGANYYRCNVYHVNDGMQGNVGTGGTEARLKLNQCWVHDLTGFQPGKFAPASPSYTSKNNGSIVVNDGGNPQKPDGSHSDVVQIQSGAYVLIQDSVLDARFDMTKDGNGSTIWYRLSASYALTDPAGNGYSVWGTRCGNACVTLNNSSSTAPTDYVSLLNNRMIGGQFDMVDWSSTNYGTNGVFTGHVCKGNVLYSTPRGWTDPEWTTTGPGGWNSDGSPKTGSMPKTAAPGYGLNFGDNTIDRTKIAFDSTNAPNVDEFGALAEWHAGGSTVVRTG